MRQASKGEFDFTILRTTAVIELIAIGAMHFLQIVATFAETPLLGVAYVGLIAATMALAAWLAVANDPRAWAGAGLLSIAIIVGYAFTRLVGTTFDNEDVGNWSCMLGLASLFVEAALVALSSWAIAREHANGRLRSTHPWRTRPRSAAKHSDMLSVPTIATASNAWARSSAFHPVATSERRPSNR
jgi:hypothetical protein